MNTSQKLHQTKLNEWANRFKEQKASGLTIRKWCEQNQLSIHAYNYWKHLLKKEVVDQMLPDIVPIPLPVPSQEPGAAATDRANCTIRANRATLPITSLIRFSINGTVIEIDDSVPECIFRCESAHCTVIVSNRFGLLSISGKYVSYINNCINGKTFGGINAPLTQLWTYEMR